MNQSGAALKNYDQQQNARREAGPPSGAGRVPLKERWPFRVGDPLRTMSSQDRRYTVTALSLLALVLLGASYLFPYWTMTLFAPQYPQGLHVQTYLNRVEGDVKEINVLNHYIGMQRLDEAAELERQLSIYAVAGLSLLGFLALFSGYRWAGWLTLPILAFPFLFLASMALWLYRFGHDLDPAAPINIDPFMPTVLGTGLVAQFQTYSMVSIGFWMAVAAALLLVAALWIRSYVCRTCPMRGECAIVCLTGFVREPQVSGDNSDDSNVHSSVRAAPSGDGGR